MNKKIFSLLIAISILIGLYNFVTFPVLAEIPSGTMEIIATTLDGERISADNPIFIDDVFRVSVYLEGFPQLLRATPSLHFNPDMVQVSDSAGTPFPTGFGNF